MALLLPDFPLFKNALAYAKDPNNIAIDDQILQKQFTYAELVFAAASLRNRLLAGKADLEEQRIAILCPSGFAYVVCQWAVWAAGGIAVPICTSHPVAEQVYTVTDSQATLLLVHTFYQDRQAALVRETGIEVLALTEQELLPSGQPATLPGLIEMDVQRRAMIIYTSGTTGKPKGAVSTHDNIDAQTSVLVDAWHWTEKDRIYHILPLHHVHGVINALACPLFAGATVEMHEKFDARKTWQRWVDTEEKDKPKLTTFMTVPTVYAKLIAIYKAAPSNDQQRYRKSCNQFRFMVSGSASLPTPMREEWERISGQVLLERYGMTELGMALSQPYDDRLEGTVGFPLKDVQVRLLAEVEGSEIGTDVSETRNVPGLLHVKGRNVFKEYWQRPEATAKEKVDGWFATGDLVMRTGQKGYYQILGRNSIDIIKTGGEKVSALEIEREILSCPSLAVADVAVVGVPDPEWGQRVAAAVVLDANETLDLDTLRITLKNRLAVYKVPSMLKVVDQLPKNAMGKVTKKDLVPLFL
ncbi:AMP-dependent synthetase and ligase [Hesseltinella vesiculosa]|uniref:AMP-dependent synthetase and ligase n=1 Tax=Hesseltinella vesiculosa TaxID=101127 RepID=A0A1X2GJ81_9FUNG|nr:AMP-dependent synthetase and ligase [Hesseltinella vesiculosa]